MANIINIGLDSVSTIKIGSDNVAAVYVGDDLVYGGSQPQTLQWVSFSAGDSVPSGDVYGIKASGATAYASKINNNFYFINGQDDLQVFNGTRNRWYYNACNFEVLEELLGNQNTDWELTFENLCSTSFTVDTSKTSSIPFDCQLYIYQ